MVLKHLTALERTRDFQEMVNSLITFQARCKDNNHRVTWLHAYFSAQAFPSCKFSLDDDINQIQWQIYIFFFTPGLDSSKEN